MQLNKIHRGDVLEVLKTFPNEFVDCIVTSPPYYGLRDYGCDGQIGLEPSLDEYLDKMLAVTTELKRVLKSTGTLWWNHGDSYGTGNGAGVRSGKQATKRGTQTNERWQQHGKAAITGYEKSLLLQAHRLAISMIDQQNWILRNAIIWWKPNCMPASARYDSSNNVPYPTMAIEDIKALPVESIAAEDATLWLWTTNAHLRVAFDVVEAWGFEYKTMLTWVKDRMGTGEWLRGQTEHCLLAARGKPVFLHGQHTTALQAIRREHSRKPEEFYALVEAACPGNRVELFCRQHRQGWDVFGNDTDCFDNGDQDATQWK